jgi:NAD(P) transhydrogenase subunit alpha
LNVVVPKEIAPGERRVALTPDVVARVVKAGNAVIVERDAGAAAGFPMRTIRRRALRSRPLPLRRTRKPG